MERWLESTERICLPILLSCIILIALHFSEGAYGAFWTYCWVCLDGVDHRNFLALACDTLRSLTLTKQFYHFKHHAHATSTYAFSICGTWVTLAAQCTKMAVNGDVTGNIARYGQNK